MGDGDEEGVRETEQIIARASQEFGEVQAFATYRVIDYHHWMLAQNGDPIRSFALSGGQVLTDSGEPTPVELSFGWYPLQVDEEDEGDEEESDEGGDGPNEEDVMKVAGEWSINPQLLGPSTASTGRGVLATAPARPRAAKDTGTRPARRAWWRFWG
jgi:hypothetical protein